jgi:putative DNA methylase
MKKKLIEVALPLEAINKESAREKSIRHGHPSTLHLWWARRPLAACRAVLFASLVDDPSSHPDKFPTEAELANNPRHMSPPLYGMTQHRDLFTPRQLVTLTTFCDLVSSAWNLAKSDALLGGILDNQTLLHKDGADAIVYVDAIATYLGLTSSKAARFITTLSYWRADENKLSRAFGRQTASMTWDFAETNPFSNTGGDFKGLIEGTASVIERSSSDISGRTYQIDATSELASIPLTLLSTDPPYYDNVPYADLSDIFYVWLRRCLNNIFPSLFSTLLVPKNQELVADPIRFGGKKGAEIHFLQGMTNVFNHMRANATQSYPTTIYYAFKQSEEDKNTNKSQRALASTGWETMLEGLLKSDFQITGTWPVRTEGTTRMRAMGSNALASSIVLVCRPRSDSAPSTTRRQFLNELKRELPEALKNLQQGNIAPVDLAQASIGPGMAIFSRYTKVLDADGSPMRIRTALQLINQMLDEFLTEQEGEFDADTRWALTWFEQNQFNEGLYGDAETLSKAKNTSVQGLVNGGILTAKSGKVRLLRRDELPDNWNPATDTRTSDWETTQYLIRTLDQKGETGAATMLSQLGDRGEIARDLAYRLYNICDRKSWTQEAIAYNSLVISWAEISRLAVETKPEPVQRELF